MAIKKKQITTSRLQIKLLLKEQQDNNKLKALINNVLLHAKQSYHSACDPIKYISTCQAIVNQYT